MKCLGVAVGVAHVSGLIHGDPPGRAPPHKVEEFLRLKEKLQAIKGSGFMRDVRCVLAHPTLMNCFIESYGLNFVPEDLKRDTVLQQVTADVDSQGGAARASHTDK